MESLSSSVKMAAEGRGFSPTGTGNPLSPGSLSQQREREEHEVLGEALTAGLKPLPGFRGHRPRPQPTLRMSLTRSRSSRKSPSSSTSKAPANFAPHTISSYRYE